MLKKINAIIIIFWLLFTNVFNCAFVGISSFIELNIGNKNISSVSVVQQVSQLAVMPSKFVNMCIMAENELANFNTSVKTAMFITKQIVNDIENTYLLMTCRINNIIKNIIVYRKTIAINQLLSKNFNNLMMFLIMISFIVGYLGLLTAKNKINNIIANININIIKLCPVV